jgi:hypothetical protein
MKTLIRSSASVITGFALGISLQSFSIAGAQNTPNISGYRDTNGNFWVTELKPKEKYTVKNVTRTGQKNTLDPKLTNRCGELRIADGAKYQSIQIEGIPTVIIPKNMPTKKHERC